MKKSPSKKILLTFGRSFLTLELARQLHAAGHQIFVADSMGYQVCRFSRAVYKNFKVPSPRFDSEGYMHALVNIIEKEKIDLLIPIYEEITHLSRAKHHFPKFCQIFCPAFDLYHELHNKWLFQCRLKDLGITHPETFLIRDENDLNQLKWHTPLALKPCYSRASQKVKKLYPNTPIPNLTIEPHNPWVAQEWIASEIDFALIQFVMKEPSMPMAFIL